MFFVIGLSRSWYYQGNDTYYSFQNNCFFCLSKKISKREKKLAEVGDFFFAPVAVALARKTP